MVAVARKIAQIVTRCFKFLRFCCEDEEELTFDVVDLSLCSPNSLFKFIDYLQDECKRGHGGRLDYIDAISEMIDFRKLHGASEEVFRKFSASELYLKRARKTVAKMMRLQWTQDLDIETLEARGHWATMEVVEGRDIPSVALRKKYIHPTRYRQIVETESVNQLTSEEQTILSEDQKHSSAVARVHYQKQRSREVALKGHDCLQKLPGAKGSEVDEDVNARLGDSTSDAGPSVETVQNVNSSPKKEALPKRILRSEGNIRNVLKFTTQQDNVLKEGITKHGFGQWTASLRDDDFQFQDGRLPEEKGLMWIETV